MAGNPKQKSTGIVNAAIDARAVVLAILIVWMMNLVSGIQGTARIINYAGLVRGKTQRIVAGNLRSAAGRHDRRY